MLLFMSVTILLIALIGFMWLQYRFNKEIIGFMKDVIQLLKRNNIT